MLDDSEVPRNVEITVSDTPARDPLDIGNEPRVQGLLAWFQSHLHVTQQEVSEPSSLLPIGARYAWLSFTNILS